MTHAPAPASAPAPGREGQTFAGDSRLAKYASFVKLPHTLFALPFAGVGALLATYEHPAGLSVRAALWIVVAFTAARFTAMGFNRIVDREQDALNPRTRLRELPSGRMSLREAWAAVLVAAAVFIFAAWQLNPLCGMLAPVALAWVCFYSWTKRFTVAAHLVLGLSLGIAPAGAYLAVAGAWPAPWYGLPLLAAAVMCWVAGFDIIYALQDEDFDRAHGLHSIPARLGARRALVVARLLHLGAVTLFFLPWALRTFPVGWAYLGGVGVMAVLLHFAHASLRGVDAGALDLKRIDRAFFHTNVGVSTSFFVLTLVDRLVAL